MPQLLTSFLSLTVERERNANKGIIGRTYMRKITIIHTVRQGYLRLGDEICAEIPEVAIANILDDELAREAVECGITAHLTNRFLLAAKLAESIHPELIVCACTSMIPLIDVVRPFLQVPIILIDDELHRQAPSMGNRVAIFATAVSALLPTKEKYEAEVRAQGAGPKEISTFVCPKANEYMRNGDIEAHDRLVLEAANKIKNVDVIILAQYSMAHLANQIEKICGCPVMGSGKYCIEEIKQILKSNS